MGLPLNTSETLNLFYEEMEKLNRKIDERINREHEQIKARELKVKLNSKLAQEAKLHAELTRQLLELEQKSAELDGVCASLESLTIAESDKNRLENARDMYQLAKELTGVRLDFSSLPNVARGYVKNDIRKLLLPFDFEAKYSHTLWDLIKDTSSVGWPIE